MQSPAGPEAFPVGIDTAPLIELNALLVDDDPDARELISEMLRRHQVLVTCASSADEALVMLQQARPDILLSDIAMPGKDGFDLIRTLRQLNASDGGSLPAIALTAYARSEDRQKILSAGFDAHVPKPVETGYLLGEILRVTSAARASPGEFRANGKPQPETTQVALKAD